ncbi:MAG: peroxiredoxin [Cellvibrionales bacterium]|nr:peroxiredoxin [Cellvibrionales bacterium]
MRIQVGDALPEMDLHTMGADGPEPIKTAEVFGGKKVVLFAVPGAFTPGCTATHLPGYVVQADEIKARGVDTVACVAVNDAFVLDAWAKAQNAEEILMLADGNGEFTRALGLELDASGFGMGTRSQRYAMIVEDGRVVALEVDGVEVKDSAAERVLELL